jgi:hypothetical protein
MSWVSSVSIVSDYRLWMTGVQSLAGAKDFSSSLCIQTSFGAHPASYAMSTRGPFPRGKVWLGRDADHSPPLVLMSRMSRCCTSSLPKLVVRQLYFFTCNVTMSLQTFISHL